MTTTLQSTPPSQRNASPTPSPAWLIVTLREVSVKVRDKSFIVSTLVTLVLIVGSVVISGFLANRTTDTTIGIVASGNAAALVQSASELAVENAQNIKVTTQTFDTSDQSIAALRSGDVDLVLTPTADGYSLSGLTDVPKSVEKLIADAAVSQALANNAEKLGVEPETLTSGSSITAILLEGSQERNSMAQIMGFIFSFLFYMSTLIFGMPIANSVVEEKQNRVVEILATAIPIRQLLAGKILGNLMLAMGQLCLFVGVGLLALTMMPTEIPFLSVVIATSGWFLAFFLAGFLILAAVWAALGAMASRVEDLQQSTGPVITVLIAVLFIGIYAKGTFLVIASYIPVISSVAMPIRLLSTDVQIWEPVAALLVAVAAAWAMVLLGERIYRRAIMQTGSALSWRKALKLEE